MAKKIVQTFRKRRPVKATKAIGKTVPRKPLRKKAPPTARKTAPGRAGKFVYAFGRKTDGDSSMKPLLGGKGANLAEMCRIGLPVPPGFTITTDVCTYFYANRRTYPAALQAQMRAGVARLEQQTGKRLGDLKNPLLVSVRSGARDSMPGMMDTILNLGLNDQTVKALATKTRNPRFAWDCYRRFIQMYGDVVLGVQKSPDEDYDPFEVIIYALKQERYHAHVEDTRLTVDDLEELVVRFKALVKARAGVMFPTAPWSQLMGAVGAVFGSWMNDRAIVYRRKYNIPSEWGTAVSVQAMVYGNTGDDSGSGVAFTRNPANGAKEFYGEFLINAQGEDVVAGVRTPEPVANLRARMPSAYRELERIRQVLERHFRDVQDFEFTIEAGVVFMLQTRSGKRTAMAALKFSIDMVKEKLIDWKTAVKRNPADQLEQLLAPVFEARGLAAAHVIATGLPAGPGAASGKIYLNTDRAVIAADLGEQVLLVRVETSPEDLRGMIAATGILTARGGVSSHAALVARQMGKVCICGAAEIEVDYAARSVTVDGTKFAEGAWMSIDGSAGKVYAGKLKTAPSEIVAGMIDGDKAARSTASFRDFEQLMKWCGRAARMAVRTNADTPEQARNAMAFGAVGIGLCRTEHMFFDERRLPVMREMILAESPEARQAALDKLLPYQREDFVGIFRGLKGYPATIRFLDPPLHEFLPHVGKEQIDLAEKIGVPVERIEQRVNQLHELNPMLGFRGCRLGIGHPEISAMQARAVFEAAALVQKEGIKVRPEVMIPLVGFKKELDLQLAVVHAVAKAVQAEQGVKLSYLVGTMIEVPRGALTADEIAKSAEFFSFGTNDLTQTALGMSRDDSGSFLPRYAELEIVSTDPFATIDRSGVGQLVEMAVAKGRASNPSLKLGICGEHGGDPASVRFFHEVGLDYVSCSPFRVPVARLAAAQAALADE
jgi:pyruvate,orthophosphate dikinase